MRNAIFMSAAVCGIMLSGAQAQQWEPGPPFPDATQPRLFATGLNHAGTLFAIGGSPFSADGAMNAAVHYLPLGGTVWQEGARVESPIVRQMAGIDALGRIIVFGGRDGVDPGGDTGAAYQYDIIEGQQGGITQRSAAAAVDYLASATDAQSRIYSIGGGPGPAATPADPNSAYVERYVAATNTWEPVAPMLSAVADAAAVYDGRGHILVLGGYDAFASARTANVACYDVAANHWSDGTVPDLPVSLSGLRAVRGADNRIYAIGGESGAIGAGTTENTVYVLDLDTNLWSAGPAMATPRRNFAVALGNDDFIYAMGGSNDSGGTYLVEKLYTPPCPIITEPPVSIDVWLGSTVQLSAGVTGGTPLTYRWRKDGIDLADGPAAGGGTLAGASTPTLLITQVGFADAGSYDLVATNPCGSSASDAAALTLRTPPAIPSSWTVVNLHPSWALSSRADDVSGDTQVGSAKMPVPPYTSLDRPTLWTGSAASAVDMTPAGSVGGAIRAISGSFQVGWWWWPYSCRVGGQWRTCYLRHGAVWSGTPASHADMHASGWEYSRVEDTDGTTHVGSASRDDAVGNVYTRAQMWYPPNYWAANLHPAPAANSGAVAVADGHQYGWVQMPSSHAAKWSGSPGSFIDMHPPGASRSTIHGAGDGQQVGMADFGGLHAALWSDAPLTFVDLNPPSSAGSEAFDASNGLQVGHAEISGQTHAGIWSGTPDSFFDLHPFIEGGFLSSQATGMDVGSDGTITVVGYGYNATTGRQEALLWRSTDQIAALPALSKPSLAAFCLCMLATGVTVVRRMRTDGEVRPAGTNLNRRSPQGIR